MISNTQLRNDLDGLAAAYKTTDANAMVARLTTGTTAIVGDGSSVYGSGDLNYGVLVGSAMVAAQAAAAPDTVNKGVFAGVLKNLTQYLKQFATGSPKTLDAYLTTLNATPYTLLVSPTVAYLYWLCSNKIQSALMTPKNVFPPNTAFGTCTVGAGGAITFTPGGAIATTNVGNVQGYCPALNTVVTCTTNVNGTLTLSGTANGWTSAGVAVTGRAWTAVIDNMTTGTSPIAIVPTNSGDRFSQITAVTHSGSPTATAGAFTISSTPDRSIS